MPCTYEDNGEAARREAAENAKLKAALCGVLRVLQNKDLMKAVAGEAADFASVGGVFAMDEGVIDAVDYDEAGITKKWLQKWWKTHQEEDKARWERESLLMAERALRSAALDKLTPAEKKALGF